MTRYVLEVGKQTESILVSSFNQVGGETNNRVFAANDGESLATSFLLRPWRSRRG